ncbi:MAG TPA: 2-C-methyl-D-erythritol 4-phosphate cytidylyltransferase [Acidiphilium sp.]|nr:MAG: 2-C-methyl-D-erythritol 4-phosphate cytidylyltransferase [Acidiphilium sp. 21-60-14]OYV90992.1 MAG: 2-C-methyl-D-erythritol 4-phosphate cytidylyltransferase [Acidiphilium sp. 37-60-79]OZB38883.1 MAG: 2-C-methyl-D-erythritol 4-phosphate cytidylyltransferase [Acidiphilium sp. 34-60-192]HQT88583.1 2-C-methyl-D-erythritol 4-phosphate cytidylyltransferase [Acidiphilium sp.]HQU24543.1 2-C-methyl-D-erythritol 4-phosphate cytidylyltransferase [Acidiphilium sp.]
MNVASKVVALVVAGGRGQRFGGPVPKQYRLLGDRSILARTVAALQAHPQIDRVQVVIHRDDRALYEAAVAGLDLAEPVLGGASRQDSVRAGLEAIAAWSPELVLIHDSVRPLVAAAVISGVIAALETGPAAMAGVPVADTLKRVAEGVVTETVERQGLWRAQTPQGFRFAGILAAHRALAASGREMTDDGMIAEAAGMAVAMVPGDERNFKITTEADLRLAELLVREAAGDPAA